MMFQRSLAYAFIALLLWMVTAGCFALPQKPYEPEFGQKGKDVIWVPTVPEVVEKMLDMAKVSARDVVIDLGSGDGRLVIAAAERGARALGIEYNPELVGLSAQRAVQAGVADKASFVKADLFASDFSQASVITMFLLPDLTVRLRPKLFNLKPGTRIVSHAYPMAEWKSDAHAIVGYRTVYLWIVPAKVAGDWQLGSGELTLKQDFQVLSGTLKTGTKPVAISKGRLRGNDITFMAGNARYTGRIAVDVMQGTVKGPKSGSWKATRRVRD